MNHSRQQDKNKRKETMTTSKTTDNFTTWGISSMGGWFLSFSFPFQTLAFDEVCGPSFNVKLYNRQTNIDW